MTWLDKKKENTYTMNLESKKDQTTPKSKLLTFLSKNKLLTFLLLISVFEWKTWLIEEMRNSLYFNMIENEFFESERKLWISREYRNWRESKEIEPKFLPEHTRIDLDKVLCKAPKWYLCHCTVNKCGVKVIPYVNRSYRKLIINWYIIHLPNKEKVTIEEINDTRWRVIEKKVIVQWKEESIEDAILILSDMLVTDL